MKKMMGPWIKAACLLSLLLGPVSFAEKKATTEDKSSAKTEVSHNFEDLLVQGKYHFTDEAVSTVEEDKVLDSLLGLRADFKDRMVQSAEQF